MTFIIGFCGFLFCLVGVRIITAINDATEKINRTIGLGLARIESAIEKNKK